MKLSGRLGMAESCSMCKKTDKETNFLKLGDLRICDACWDKHMGIRP
jgi:hypothetical protein